MAYSQIKKCAVGHRTYYICKLSCSIDLDGLAGCLYNINTC